MLTPQERLMDWFRNAGPGLHSRLDHVLGDNQHLLNRGEAELVEHYVPNGKMETQVATPARPPHSSTLSACWF